MAEKTGEVWVDRAIHPESGIGIGMENTFSGVLSLFRRHYRIDPTGVDVAVTGIPYDLAVTNRPGTRFGPRAVRAASCQLAWPGGYWPWPFDPFEELETVDTGDMAFDFGHPANAGEAIAEHARGIISTGASMISIGGDHFITHPLLKAHAERYGPLALVQFDAHSDTWRESERRIDHGTMFFHAVEEGIIDASRSVQIGIRTGNEETHGFTILDADWVHEQSPASVAEKVAKVVGDGPAYLTFDIDCLDPAFAPGTGTPVCGGLSSWQARKILQGLTAIEFVGMDLVEVSPAYDQSEVTALAGATMILDYLCLRATRARNKA